jgi:endonuclease/exonuclease/phosphatase family metal-dependent hydrolase
VTAVATLLVLSVGWPAGCSSGRAASNPSSPAGTTLRVLQVNLCNSGRADCYSGGRAVSLAATLISHHRPEMVSLNEICREDVDILRQAMSTAFDGAVVASAFKSAEDGPTRTPVRCRNGQEFGDGVLAVVASTARGYSVHSGVYPMQDPDDVEERVWVCLDLASQFSACTTHAASTSPTVALAQCRYLLTSAVRMMRGHDDRGDPIIVGGDLNIEAGGSPSPQACLPHGYQRADDGALQYVVASPGIAVRSRSVIDVHGATDHPGLLVELVLPRR